MRNATSVATRASARSGIAPVESGPAALVAPATFYINRDCDGDRRENIERQLKAAGIAAERIDGVNGLAVPHDLREYFFENDKLCSSLKPGEVGCYASHLKALKTLLARGLDYALVVEDDAILPHDLPQIVQTVLVNAPPAWDYIHLSGDVQRAFKPVASLGVTGKLVRYSRVPGGTVGYLISREGARKFLVPSKRIWPIDTDFRRPWTFRLDIFGVHPRVINHSDDLGSPIQALGGRALQRRGLPKPSRHSLTGNPLHSLGGAYHNIRSMGLVWWAVCCWRNAQRKLLGSKASAAREQETAVAVRSGAL
jgi:glycosyl transferase family 25